jgi:hypothetical protein
MLEIDKCKTDFLRASLPQLLNVRGNRWREVGFGFVGPGIVIDDLNGFFNGNRHFAEIEGDGKGLVVEAILVNVSGSERAENFADAANAKLYGLGRKNGVLAQIGDSHQSPGSFLQSCDMNLPSSAVNPHSPDDAANLSALEAVFI